jgi:hypothetical protein
VETTAEPSNVSAVPEVAAADTEQKAPESSGHAQTGGNLPDSSNIRKEKSKTAALPSAPNIQNSNSTTAVGNTRKAPNTPSLSWAQVAK